MALVTDTELADVLHMQVADDPSGFAQVADAADEVVSGLLIPGVDHTLHARCKEAALNVAAEIYQSRYTAGGQSVTLDMGIAPSRLSQWLTRRVSALTAECYQPGAMVG